MSLVFKRVNEITYEDQPTFDLSSSLYEALLGDNNFPTSADGALPVVVEVPLGIIAALLFAAGAINLEEVKAGKQTVGELEFWKNEASEAAFTHAIVELRESPDRLKLLLSDYRLAVARGWGGILYHV